MTQWHIRMLCMAVMVALTACGGSADHSQSGGCSADPSMTVLTGTVTAVHDGDTLTLHLPTGNEHIRLQGIDAPELAQPYGDAARQALNQRTLNQAVRVAYVQRDRYDRVLGQVFDSDCADVNEHMLSAGMAWFYTAYACELERSRRTLYAEAQAQARAQQRGLWRQRSPTAPWVFRNGEDTPTPGCSD